jgi:Raf kinase inhibitor-like YbhB/YbcL family protein
MSARGILLFHVAAAAVLTMTAVFPYGCGNTHGSEPNQNEEEGAPPMTIKLTSAAFEAGKPIPKQYTGEGNDISPALAWSDLPEGTKEMALICDDPDAPRKEPWVHWVLAKIPADANGLAEGASAAKADKHPEGMVEGKNDFGTIGYQGPMPPPGKAHRYFFRLYALDTSLEVKQGLTKADLLKAMDGHILATGELMGTYER